jgi:hypothetical protein
MLIALNEPVTRMLSVKLNAGCGVFSHSPADIAHPNMPDINALTRFAVLG